jgi:hypothetical protein
LGSQALAEHDIRIFVNYGVNMKKSIETYFLFFVAAISGLVSLLDFFDLLNAVPWLADRIPTLTLLLVSGLLGYLASEVAGKLDDVRIAVHDLRSLSQQETSERILSLRKQIDPNLEVVFGEHISDLLANVERTLKERTIQLHDVDLFRYFYKRTLERYSRATFLATSLPYQRYFWKNQPMEQAIAQFVAGRGTMKRIFFISDPEELNYEEIKEVLSIQCNIGVEVYITDARKAPPHLSKYFVVDTRERIAWEVFVGPTNEIVNILATSDPKSTKKYLRIFQELLELDGTERYSV